MKKVKSSTYFFCKSLHFDQYYIVNKIFEGCVEVQTNLNSEHLSSDRSVKLTLVISFSHKLYLEILIESKLVSVPFNKGTLYKCIQPI